MERPAVPALEREPAVTRRVLLALAVTVGAARLLLPLPHTLPPRLGVDFPAYYWAGRSVLAGEAHDLYTADVKEFQNLPIVAVFFLPLGALSYEAAWRMLWWANLAAMVGTLAVLLRCVARFFPPLTLDRGSARVYRATARRSRPS